MKRAAYLCTVVYEEGDNNTYEFTSDGGIFAASFVVVETSINVADSTHDNALLLFSIYWISYPCQPLHLE